MQSSNCTFFVREDKGNESCCWARVGGERIVSIGCARGEPLQGCDPALNLKLDLIIEEREEKVK